MIRVEASRDAIVALDFDDVVYLGYIIVSGQKGWAFLWGQIPGWTQQSFFRALVEGLVMFRASITATGMD